VRTILWILGFSLVFGLCFAGKIPGRKHRGPGGNDEMGNLLSGAGIFRSVQRDSRWRRDSL